jgi:hypothetical protein
MIIGCFICWSTLTVITASLVALGKSFSEIWKFLSQLKKSSAKISSTKTSSIKIKFQTKDGRMLEIEGNLSDPEEIEKLIAAFNVITSDSSDKPSESKGGQSR